MNLSVVFGFVTIVVLFQFVYADVKPLTLTEIETNSDVQLKPDSVLGEKLLRVPRNRHRGYYPQYGGGCFQCGGYGGYGGGLGGYGGNIGGSNSQSFSQSSSSSSSGSINSGYGKKK